MQPLNFPDIKSYFPYHGKPVIGKVLNLAYCLMRCQSANIMRCKNHLGNLHAEKALKPESYYKYLLRLFSVSLMGTLTLCLLLFSLSLLPALPRSLVLAIDRTNWDLGKKKINILALGIVLPGKIFIPIIFDLLDKKGNSNQSERSDLLSRFIELWNSCTCVSKSTHQFILTADREFIGSDWFKAIVDAGFDFVIRLRKDSYHHPVAQSLGINMSQLNDKIRQSIRNYGFFQTKINIKGRKYYYTVFRQRVQQSGDDNEFFFVLSTMQDKDTIIQAYDMRWGIECFFKHLKTNGFHLEDLNLKNAEAIGLMVAILGLVYMLSIKEGYDKKYEQSVKIKYNKSDNKKSFPAQSLFKYGNEHLLLSINSTQKLKAHLQKHVKKITPEQINLIEKQKKKEAEIIEQNNNILIKMQNVQ